MRKKFLVLAALAALAAALSACDKVQNETPEIQTPEVAPREALVFTATMEYDSESKATFDNTVKCASWEEGDQICINGFNYVAKTSGLSTTFSGLSEVRPEFVSSPNTHWYGNNPPANLVDEGGTSTRWCVHKDDKYDGAWTIVVTTGSASLLKSIKLWNADNATPGGYPGRRWKEIEVFGAATPSDRFHHMSEFEDLGLEANKYEYAGEAEINSTKAYSLYQIKVYENEGDAYMQMSDMKFVLDEPDITAPFNAYFPSNLFTNGVAALPATVSETWVDGQFNMPMCAYNSEDTDLHFKNLCGVLKVTVKSAQIAAVKSIRISSSDKAMSGKFTVGSDNAAVLSQPTAINNVLVVNYTEAVPTTADGTVFYVAIPAQTYKNLRIELSSDGTTYSKRMTTKTNVNIAVERNKIYPITYSAENIPSNPDNDPLKEEDWGDGGFTQN